MKIRKKGIALFLLAAAVLLTVSSPQAGTGKRRGTAGALELLIPVGSRGTGLGGNVNSMVYGIDALHWNPAGLALSPAPAEIMVSHFKYIADINVNYAAGAAKFGFGNIGISVKSLDFGEIPVTTEQQTEGTGESLNPAFVTIGLTYSRQMTDKISFGATAKIISEKILRTSASGFAFDFGLQYATSLKGLKLGIVLKNLGPNMKFDGSDLESRQPPAGSEPGTRNRNFRISLAAFELPSTLEMGISYDLGLGEGNNLTVGGNFTNHNFGLDQYGVSAEYVLNKAIFLRGGYALAYDSDQSKFVSQSDEYLFGPSFGAGVKMKLGESMDLNLDYAYRTAEFFDDNQWFTITLGF